ncbi:Holliday junction branch migration DNA helicase RuvB [Patescibacteria group bacterium]|nr:Holliday junction branch migration DNA helicase RuvB [Patescibacteria group bacterium]MBU1721238.1 Holliday junction branch migration DNA helicase RuvB [Patescibacteria group bacterium]MBU1901054.1 Holliday junction branch migration DNA helicase RuvB [Patescibacteria group bacterium]
MINAYETTTEKERPISPDMQQEDTAVDVSLRPTTLEHFIGQSHIKNPLRISITAAQKREEPIDHVLLYGNPGLGKTTLANIIAKEMHASIKITAGPALERVGDLAAILSNLQSGDILFIDEIHRMNKTIEEILYTAMEDFAIDIIVGKGPTARTLRMPLEPFTLIGATTKLNLLSSPLRDRFGHVYHLEFYEHTDIESIIKRNATILDIQMDDDAATLISTRARRTPRIANRLLKRSRDYSQVKHNGIMSKEAAEAALVMLRVDHHGLDDVDRKLLKMIIDNFSGGPVGLNTLAAATGEDMETIETIYEPYLLQMGLLERTPRGRKATAKAYTHLQKSIH